MYPPHHPSQPQITHSSVPPSQQYQSHQASYVLQIAYISPQPSTQPLTKFHQVDSGLAVPVFNQGDDPIACLNKEDIQGWLNVIIIKVNVTWLGNALSQRGLGMLHGIPNGQTAQTTIPNTAAFQTKDLDAYDSDYDDVSNAKAVLMANLSNYGSDVILEVPHSDSYHNDMDNQSVHAM
uniref:Uncharacterized protein n=1 Tax=Tanacetum cinerariifolium TaxID=118510 RepID=A0A6L2L0A8_TANCI|nr:hypothetical protein [Tanacetum cinerariifolium]